MIGVFDSGLGGLTTLKELQKILPEYQYLYLGDTANNPYGKRSASRVRELTEAGINFLFSKGAQIVLIACNTASTDALRYLQEKYPEKKILGVLIPAVEKALENSRYGKIGIIATQHTIDSRNFEKEIQKKYNEYSHLKKTPVVTSSPAPLLVPLIEEGWAKKPETTSILKKYLLKIKAAQVDTLILGCTHYPILKKIFERKMGKNCVIINSGQAQAEKFKTYLINHPEISEKLQKYKAINKEGNKHKAQFFTTDCQEKFSQLGQKFLGISLQNVEKIEI